MPTPPAPPAPPMPPPEPGGEDGSLVSEYGLVAVLGATIVGAAISWARGGAIASLLAAVLRQVQAVVGA